MPGRSEKRVGQARETRVPPAAHSPRTQSSDMAKARTSLRHTSAARRAGPAPSFLSAGAAPPRAVRLAGPAATHGASRRPRSPLPRSRPGSHGRSEQRKGLRLRRPTEDWARPGGAIAAKRERPELPPVTPARIRAGGLGGAKPQGHAPSQSTLAQSADPAPSGARRRRGPLHFPNLRD